MNGSVAWEFAFLGFNLLLGLGTGLFFDCYRAFRRIVKPGRLATQLLDLLFWITSALLVFAGFYWATGGEISLYTMLMLPLGMVIYLRLASPLVREGLYRGFCLVGRGLRFVWLCIWRALSLLVYPYVCLKVLLHYLLLLVIWSLRLLLLPLVLAGRLLRRMLKEGVRHLARLLKKIF